MLQGVVQTERDINNKKQREDVEDKKTTDKGYFKALSDCYW